MLKSICTTFLIDIPISMQFLFNLEKADCHHDKMENGQSIDVKDARLTQMYSFLPVSWVGDTHKETDFLPIGDQEVKEGRLLVRRIDSLEMIQVLVARYL